MIPMDGYLNLAFWASALGVWAFYSVTTSRERDAWARVVVAWMGVAIGVVSAWEIGAFLLQHLLR